MEVYMILTHVFLYHNTLPARRRVVQIKSTGCLVGDLEWLINYRRKHPELYHLHTK